MLRGNRSCGIRAVVMTTAGQATRQPIAGAESESVSRPLKLHVPELGATKAKSPSVAYVTVFLFNLKHL